MTDSKPFPRPQQSLPNTAFPGGGTLPLQSGKAYTTDMVSEQLKLVGWKEGDPIPADLGEKLQQIQKSLKQQTIENHPEAGNWKPVKPSFVKIEDLPAEKQQEVAAYLQEYKQIQAQKANAESARRQYEEMVPESIQGESRKQLVDQLQASSNAAEGSIVDDREQPQPVQPQQPVYADPPSPPPATDTNLPCPRCKWPTAVPFDIDITDQDKQIFVLATITGKPFEKVYPLFGGNAFITFRDLTDAQSNMLKRALTWELQEGYISGDGAYLARLAELRLAMSTARFEGGGNLLYAIPDISEWERLPLPAGEKNQSDVQRLVRHFYANVGKNESLCRLLNKHRTRFQQVIEKLEDVSDDTDFWQGIGTPA